MNESFDTFGTSKILHGPRHARACLTVLDPRDAAEMVEHLEALAAAQQYTKICARVSAVAVAPFVDAGFHMEATLPGFLPRGETYCFLAKYLEDVRKAERQPQVVQKILEASGAQQRSPAAPLAPGFVVRQGRERDASRMAGLLRVVAADSPLGSGPEELRSTIRGGTLFAGIWRGNTPVSLATAGIDDRSETVEVSCLGTLPEHRGHGFSLLLLEWLEKELHGRKVRSVFGTAPAGSMGKNLNFARSGYQFGGTLTNEVCILGRMESLNVWHKTLRDDHRLVWSFLYE